MEERIKHKLDQCIRENSIQKIRILIKDAIISNKNRKEAEEIINYVRNKNIDVFVDNDCNIYDTNDKNEVASTLIDNFSKERLNKLIKLVSIDRKDSDIDNSMSKTHKKHNTKKEEFTFGKKEALKALEKIDKFLEHATGEDKDRIYKEIISIAKKYSSKKR